MRQLKIDLPTLQRGVVKKVTDTKGRNWEVVRGLSDAAGAEQTEFIVLSEIPRWTIYIEGYEIGTGDHPEASEAMRGAFQAAGLTSLPEAVFVKAVSEGETFAIFGLEGKMYSVPLQQFNAEIEKSNRWTFARQAKRPEIDALLIELKKLSRRK